MDKYRKRLLLLALSVVIVAMLLLSTGLSELEFLEGQPFPLGRSPAGVEGGYGGLPQGELFALVFRVLMFVAVLLLPFSIIYLIISREARRRLLLRFLLLLPILAALYVLAQQPQHEVAPPDQDQLQPLSGIPEDVPVAGVDAPPPQWFLSAVSGGCALLVAMVIVALGWFVWRSRRRIVRPLEQLAQQAEETIEDIQAGADLRDTVMRCYFEMGRVLRQQRGIQRHQAMTPREFVAYLEEVGLPTEAAGRLTELFEQVRYGAKSLGQDEGAQALACLETIVEFCRSAG
jgi:hypothetical protein